MVERQSNLCGTLVWGTDKSVRSLDAMMGVNNYPEVEM
jgi:hypothetical protein